MRVCLVPLKIEDRDPTENLLRFQQRLEEIAPHQPDLICLPEWAFTGYLYQEQDFQRFAEPVPGPTTTAISKLARENQTYICLGMLEKAKEGVYSSAVLIDKSGQIVLVHRKISEQPPFATGTDVKAIQTEFGRLAILLCADLFDNGVKAKLDRRADILIVPFSRSFDGKSPDSERWLKTERQVYVDEARKGGITTLVVNSLDDESVPEASFGGAMIVSPDGEILAESPHGTDEVLLFDAVNK